MSALKGLKNRLWRPDDNPAIVARQKAAHANHPPEAPCDELHSGLQLAAFPEGQVLAELDGRVAGYTTSLINQLDDESPRLSYGEITGMGTFSTHNPMDDTLDRADITKLDLSDRAMRRELGSVRPLRARCRELYELQAATPSESAQAN